ncbi:hypothetical protein PPTG_22052 [Phytophthora nicotianae INRA-310]|uniref:Uncharacterized protein n=1 Tax=Phytophthora nicotianae (strain INRA-310) TaxID=761204 RepID=W2QRX3_PHYN3|nr:hypothetical protein PPTG_22052 [Phytophthora nicotianae INRA-310]ETN15010.1 hypothetical protein PPTG_22052 [Phytophthora nicotianae INRA-310]
MASYESFKQTIPLKHSYDKDSVKNLSDIKEAKKRDLRKCVKESKGPIANMTL